MRPVRIQLVWPSQVIIASIQFLSPLAASSYVQSYSSRLVSFRFVSFRPLLFRLTTPLPVEEPPSQTFSTPVQSISREQRLVKNPAASPPHRW